MRMAAYCRVSTASDEQLNSLKNQESFFADYAKKCGDELVKIYADEGISGKKMQNRTEFLQLLSDSDKNLFDVVVTKDISRFARNTADFLVGIRQLKSNNIDVRFLSNNQTLLGDSEFVLTLFAALAQQESENLSKRVIFGKKQSAKKGRTPSLIYGYDKTGTFSLEINKKEADTVRLIFALYADLGIGSRKIADFLNERSIQSKKGGLWSAKAIIRILKNPIYIGILQNNKSQTDNFLSGTRKVLPKDEWNVHKRENFRIIDDKTFNKAQKILQSREKTQKFSQSNNLFYSLAVCKFCGRPLVQSSKFLMCRGCKAKAEVEHLKNEIFSFLNSLILKSGNETDFSPTLIRRNEKQKSGILNLYKNGLITFSDMQERIGKINLEQRRIISCNSENFEFSNFDLIRIIDKIEIGNEVNVYFKAN